MPLDVPFLVLLSAVAQVFGVARHFVHLLVCQTFRRYAAGDVADHSSAVLRGSAIRWSCRVRCLACCYDTHLAARVRLHDAIHLVVRAIDGNVRHFVLDFRLDLHFGCLLFIPISPLWIF